MEESGGSGSGRQDHARTPADGSSGGYSCARGGGSGGSGSGSGAGAGAGAGAGTGSGAGWTDMFQGMTVEVRARARRADRATVLWCSKDRYKYHSLWAGPGLPFRARHVLETVHEGSQGVCVILGVALPSSSRSF